MQRPTERLVCEKRLDDPAKERSAYKPRAEVTRETSSKYKVDMGKGETFNMYTDVLGLEEDVENKRPWENVR